MEHAAETVPESEILFFCEQCSTVFLDERDADAHGATSGHDMHRLVPAS
jgi:hypothetical protein